MTSETTAAKARRYLTEGCLTVIRVDGDVIDAVLEGGTGTYELGREWARGWHCTCPARGRCSHVAALKLVTLWTPAAVPAGSGIPLREAS